MSAWRLVSQRVLAVVCGVSAAVAPITGAIGPAGQVLAVNDKAPEVILLGEMAAEGAAIADVIVAWDEIIDPGSIPAPADFTVTINGGDHQPAAVEFLLAGLATPAIFNADGLSFIQLELPSGVTWSSLDSVLVDYTPGTAPVRDLGLGVAAAFTDLEAFAFDPGDEFAAIEPIVDSYYGADHVVVGYVHPLAALPLPDPADFAVTVDGAPVGVLSVGHAATDVGMGLVDLQLAAPVTDPDATVLVSYTPGTNPLVSARTGASAPALADVAAVVIVARTTAAASVPPGGSVSTAGPDGPTVADPLEATIVSPTGGDVSLEEVTVAGDPPSGYGFFGRQLEVSAPPAASPADPLVLTLAIDASIVPDGEEAATIVVFRNGVPIGPCGGAPGAADPDPCVAERVSLPDGDVAITIHTTAASSWNVGFLEPYAFGGFKPPVDGDAVNVVRAGLVIPIRFSLGGDRGRDVLEPGSPSVQRLTSCGGGPTGDPPEAAQALGHLPLLYNPWTDTYIYLWRTARAWRGSCRSLDLAFADGSTASAVFDFR